MAQSTQQVNQAIANVASVAEENGAAAEEVSAATEEVSAQTTEVLQSAALLADLAHKLEDGLSVFQKRTVMASFPSAHTEVFARAA
jgi:methyl-accepting chemotaxis protein